MGGSIPLTGPDFGAGIPDLDDGATLVGQYDGNAVIAARKGAEYFVVAAACSHWGDSMANGIVVGETIRCPSHHSCFSLRTGDPVCPPALSPIQAYRVVNEGKKRRVAGKAEPATLRNLSGGPASVVIVGGGAAGAACALALRAEGYLNPVVLISADSDLPCDRPNVSKDYLAGNAPEEWLFLRDKDGWKGAGVEVLLNSTVQSIDRESRMLSIKGGATMEYGALLLAPGAEAIRLPIPGADLPHVHLLRTVADGRKIVEAAKNAKSAVVLGSSFIGMEAAASLKARGLEVHVVSPDAVPFEKALGPIAGGVLHAAHLGGGVSFHMGTKPASINKTEVVLEGGMRLKADLVVMGVGVRPSLALAEAAGLKTDKGVLVDGQMRTSDAHIWAAGDVARYADPRSKAQVRIEHWVVAQRQGQTAAKSMLGQNVTFDAVPFFWTTQFGVSLRYVGHAESWDSIAQTGDPKKNDCAFAYRKGGKTLAAAFYGRDRDALIAEDALARGDEATLSKLVP
ncbi:MAG: FAD-dependent oxidoreductase [Myxococcaceae bacterium]